MALAAALCAASGAARPPSFTPPASRASRRASPASAPCHRRACARAALAQREPAAQPTASAPLDSQEDLYHLFPRLHAPLSLELAAWAPFGLVVAPLRLLVWVSLALLDQPALSDADAPLRFIVHSLLVRSVRSCRHLLHLSITRACARDGQGSSTCLQATT